MKLKRLYKALTHPSDAVEYLVQKTCLPDKMSDESYLKLIYWIKFHKKLNLENPVTFNEKLQWLKLHDHNPDYVKMVDKITAKEYVADIIGWEYIIPTIAVYDSVDEINLKELPDSFVLKTNHSGGNSGVVICKDKKFFDIEDAKGKLRESLKSNMYRHSREWPYKEIRPRILAEKFMSDIGDGDLKDYKFFCFDGKVNYYKVDINRNVNHKAIYFTRNGQRMQVGEVACPPDCRTAINLPSNINSMIEIAERISNGLKFVRVDLYNIRGKVYFGELTFYPASGLSRFTDDSFDIELGRNLIL